MEKGSPKTCNQQNKQTFQDSLQQFLAAKYAMLSQHHCLYNNNKFNSLLISTVVVYCKVFLTAFITMTTCPWLTCKRNIHSIIKSPSCLHAYYLAICTSRGKEWTIWGVLHTVHKVGVSLLLNKLLRVFHWHLVNSNYKIFSQSD